MALCLIIGTRYIDAENLAVIGISHRAHRLSLSLGLQRRTHQPLLDKLQTLRPRRVPRNAFDLAMMIPTSSSFWFWRFTVSTVLLVYDYFVYSKNIPVAPRRYKLAPSPCSCPSSTSVTSLSVSSKRFRASTTPRTARRAGPGRLYRRDLRSRAACVEATPHKACPSFTFIAATAKATKRALENA